MINRHQTPSLAADIIIEVGDGIVLIERKNPPFGWALPGGFIEYGESLESCAVREALEETSLEVTLKEQFHTYSDPGRDPRGHTVSTVFLAAGDGIPRAADDAANVKIFLSTEIPGNLVFDHGAILEDYFRYRNGASKKAIFASRMSRPDLHPGRVSHESA
jgi:ADP-ribose pyrophosphatase YjhB (NUDIX family)